MYGEFFGGFDFNGDSHISGYERASAIHYIDSMSSGHSGSTARNSGSGSSSRSGSYGGSGSRSISRTDTKLHSPSFCNIYGGYYASRKNDVGIIFESRRK